jgi:hypothetical protein
LLLLLDERLLLEEERLLQLLLLLLLDEERRQLDRLSSSSSDEKPPELQLISSPFINLKTTLMAETITIPITKNPSRASPPQDWLAVLEEPTSL